MMRGLAVTLLLLAGWVLSASGRQRLPPRDSWHQRLRRWRPSRRPQGAAEVTRVLVEVSTRLRAGTPLAEAWRRSLPEPAPPWANEVMTAAGSAAAAPPVGPRSRSPARRRRRDRGSGDVAAAVAACRLAARTGAPLAEVIDVLVSGVAEAAEADELRRTALAGPRATARLLAWLPAGGIALGTVLGADPVAVLLGGGAGGLCLVGGGALFLAGHRWVQALVADAERAGR